MSLNFTINPIFKSCFFVFFLTCGVLSAQSYTARANYEFDVTNGRQSFFPGAYLRTYNDARNAWEASRPYWVPTEAEAKAVSSFPVQSILLNNDILAYYGHPLSKYMGILGRFSKQELNTQLTTLAQEYDAVNGPRGVKKAFYIIYGTVWPGGDIGIIKESVLLEYIEYAQANDMLVFIDHQIGRFDPIDSLRRMLPYLRYPNVHLALDPEWRTTRPGSEIGTVTADEINRAQRVMEDYIIENNIPGERILAIHQFNWIMISDRPSVRANFHRVRLVHTMDGHGPPNVKLSTYANNAAATNMPVKGFKLFYNFNLDNAGVDIPLLTPRQVLELKPRPYLIMYQ